MPPLVHHPDYDAATVSDDHRFPMRKYSLVASALRARGATFHEPVHAPVQWLQLAHDAAYVDAVLTSTLDRAASRKIGFEITPAIARRSRASCAGTALAARLAIEYGAAANLAGGSHHAFRESGAGFCVFNDVAVAGTLLLSEGLVRRIAVIDCDVHHGDGTASIFADDPRVFTASLHCEDNWPRTKPPSDLDIGLPKGAGDADYSAALDALLEQVFTAGPFDLVFFNAGVDPHTEDRLGLLELSDHGLETRDLRVAEACAARGTPICGVLGGGYGKDPAQVAARHLYMVSALGAVMSR